MFLTAVMAATLAVAGCSKSGVDTSSLEKSFKSADAAIQSSVDKAVSAVKSAVKSADYSGALSDLKSLVSKAKLTPEQEQAIKDVMAQIEKVVADAAKKAVGDAQKAADDLTKSLKK